jgi:hypothetical protein
MADRFLSRWSQRKLEVRAGKLPLEPVAAPSKPRPEAPLPAAQAATPPTQPAPQDAAPAAAAPMPTLEDVGQLTSQSDFKPYVAPGVAAEVRNAAMKKLFTDPHYNVMDRLDIYIDDYSQSDPIPLAMLRQMASAKFLNLFDDEEEKSKEQEHAQVAPVRDDAPIAQADFVPESLPNGACPSAAPDPPEPVVVMPPEPQQNTANHDHTDLRLQQDDAAGSPGAGRGSA